MAYSNRTWFIGTFQFLVGNLLLFSLAITGIAASQNPVPLINEPVVPDAIKSGGSGFTLTVNGTGFVVGAVVKWNGSPRTTSFVSGSTLRAAILASDIATPRTASVTVVNPKPGGGTSNVIFFEVANPTPVIALTTSAFRAGSMPSWVATGDFNGDGNLDLVVTNSGSNNVSILLGNGDGTFRLPVNYGAGAQGDAQPAFVAVGDFNDDGHPDLVVANFGTPSNVAVLLGNGDGTFRAAVAYGTGNEALSVAVGDFNRDGKQDLAVADDSGVSVLLGNGDGTFQPASNYPAASGNFSVVVGDFNRDGKQDLAVADGAGVSVLLGNGDGTFRAPVDYGAGTEPASVAVADFNGDGKLDLAVANYNSDNISVLLGKGDGTFRPALDYRVGSGPRSVAVGDLNGDGKLDLIVANNAANGGTPSVSLLLGKGDGTFHTAVDYSSGTFPESVAVGDFDGDAKLDVAVAEMGDNSYQVFVLSTSVTFADQLLGTTSQAQPITLTNYGTSTLSITDIDIRGTDARDFAQNHTCGNSIAPAASCTIDVTFTPEEIGTRAATLSIADSTMGSPQTVSLKGAGTVVKVVPSGLDFGSIGFGKSSTLTTTLTNIGSAMLRITGITISGIGYSQTHTCGSSLEPGKSCSIRVTFKPPSVGFFPSVVYLFDNGGGSPQQVPLSGSGSKPRGSAEMRSALTAQSIVTVPTPTGASRVGTRVMDLVDSGREDPFLADGTKRELLVRFWYPASLNQGCKWAEYTSPEVWSYFSELLGSPLPEVRTNSCLDAPITDGPHPLVVFTHGYTGTFTDYSFIFEDLASRGYVVASVDHTYEATAVEFPDGRFVKSVFGSHLAEMRSDGRAFSIAVSVRLRDLKFVVDELERLNGEADEPFSGKLDMARIAVAGHSLGGIVALLAVEQDPRLRAGITIDGVGPEAVVKPTRTPVLILAAGREEWRDNECRLWKDLRGPRLAVNLKSAEHVTPSDAVWLAKGAVNTGPMGSDKTIFAVRDYLAAFLDGNLRGKAFDPLLTGPSSEYPDITVTTQKQSLCGDTMKHSSNADDAKSR